MNQLNKDALEKKQRLKTGIKNSSFKTKGSCSGCLKGKNDSYFPSRSRKKSCHVLKLVQSYLMGPMKKESKGGANYGLIVVDEQSKYVVVHVFKKKSKVPRF